MTERKTSSRIRHGVSRTTRQFRMAVPVATRILSDKFPLFHSYRTILCVLFDVRIIAAACFIIAQRVVEGEHSPSLAARISSTSPATSLPTPPTHKPTSPDASRFVVELLQFSEDELVQLARESRLLLNVKGATKHPASHICFISELTPAKL